MQTASRYFSVRGRREESRRGRHECLRHGAEYTLSYGIAAQTPVCRVGNNEIQEIYVRVRISLRDGNDYG